MLELTIERYLMDKARQRGGLAIKHGTGGYMDRIVVLHGKHGWLELKRPGERLRPLQVVRAAELRAAGALVGWADSFSRVDEFLDQVEAQQ